MYQHLTKLLLSGVVAVTFWFGTAHATHKGAPHGGGSGGGNSQTLGSLSCATDQIARWDGTSWVCFDDLETTIPDMDTLADSQMKLFLSTIVTWLSINFGLPPNHDHPTIKLLPATQIANIHNGTSNSGKSPEVIATYDDAMRTIFLADSWTGRTAADLSILVHEMVHHLQNVGGLQYECPASREKLAYAAQNAWLGLFGQNLLAEFELDRMTLKLTTKCMPY